jgi:hypothetical protein
MLLFRIEQLEIKIALALDVNLDFKGCILVRLVEDGLDAEILEVCSFGESQKEDVSEDATHSPLILIFDVGRVAVLVDPHGEHIVFATLDVFGDVELSRVT